MLRRFGIAALIAAVSCLPVGAQTNEKPVSVTGEIFTKIQKLQIKRLAVCPRIISRDQNGENPTFKTDLGPLGARLATQVRDQIRQVNDEGNYKVEIVPDGAIREALSGVSAADLYQDEVQSKLRKRTDAIVLLYDNTQAESEGGELQIQTDVLDVRKGEADELVSRNDSTQLSLSDAAYAGQSFTVRTASDNIIKPISSVPAEYAFGVGLDWERYYYTKLAKDEPHPLQEKSNPFAFQISANDEPREIWINPKDGKAYVALNFDEQFTVSLKNGSKRTVLQSLIIDGVNSISQKTDGTLAKQHPMETEYSRHWYTKPTDLSYPIAGYLRDWQGKAGTNKSNTERFKVGLKVDSVAQTEGISDHFGLITVIVYALRMDGYEEFTGDPPAEVVKVAAKDASGFELGIGAGLQEQKDVEGQTGERGVMLTAMTVNYVTSKQLQALKDGTDGGDNKKESDTIPDTEKDKPGKAGATSKTVGEDKQF